MIRIDDVGVFDPERDIIIYNLCKQGLRVTCAVVPTWLDEQTTAFLCAVQDEFPDLLELHQHGYSHANYGDALKPYEFGPSRSYAQQLEDIMRGGALLAQKLGERCFAGGFTPPYSLYDHNTLRALKAAGFQAISGYVDDAPNQLLPNYCPDVDCFHWHPMMERSWDEIVLAWNAAPRRPLRGLILHPRLMSTSSVTLLSDCIPRLIQASSTVGFRQLLGAPGLTA